MSRIQNFWLDKRNSNGDCVSQCCGCSACANKCPKNAITMRYDQEGFLYPTIDDKLCIECGLCVKICPIKSRENLENPYMKTYAGYSLDAKIMYNSTSGGFITALSLKIIDNEGIIAGVRYKTDYIKTEYFLAENKEDVFSCSSSKYVQSEKNIVYQKVESQLKRGKQVLFVGCPCDVYAMQQYLGKSYSTLLTCELVCMGVSSYKIAEAYKEYVEKKYKAKLCKINARSKRKGWFVPHLEEEYGDGRIECNTLYGTFLGYGMQVYNRPSCFQCKFRGTKGVADIRVGDFWGIKETDPYWNEKGVSCILVRTEKGKEALAFLEKSEFLLYETDYETATLSNMSSHSNKSYKYVKKREKFKRVFERRGLIDACVATGTISFWTKHIIPDQYHNVIKKFYHAFKDKR
ncbi:Coenzyme F420 hydrogenase/dehydrogenase, beta subunit C-terminal domain [Faecalicatena sp. Marseille-Q4148]|nr:Coenzyme F420 hydrogenase/dehydrogenase, beta subunit C-terminal domain [Faecalicatena sp. Marseille-Q4148]